MTYGLSLDIDTDNGEAVDCGADAFIALHRRALILNGAVEIEAIKFERDAEDPLRFRYLLKAADGRKWEQDIRFAGPGDADPAMTFGVTDAWKVSEFSLHRPVREHMVEIRNAYPHVWMVAVRFKR